MLALVLTFVLTFVLASLSLVALVFASLSFVTLVLTTLSLVAASLLTTFCLAAVLSAAVHTTLAVLCLAGGVSAHAVVLTLVGASLFANSSFSSLFDSLGSVVVASGHTQSESCSDGNGQENLFHCLIGIMVFRPG